MRPHSIWGQNKIWFFKSQSIYLNERAFLHLPSRLFFSLSFSYFQRLPSFLWLARGMYILWGFFPLHQWLKTQQAVNFVPVAVTLGNRTCLSPSLTFPHFVQGRTLLRAPAVTLVWSGAAVAGFLKLHLKSWTPRELLSALLGWWLLRGGGWGFFKEKVFARVYSCDVVMEVIIGFLLVALFEMFCLKCTFKVFSLHLSLLCQL